MNIKYLWFVPALVIIVSIFLLSTVLSDPVVVDGFDGMDKVKHGLAYFALTITLLLPLKKLNKFNIQVILMIGLGSIGYGLFLEWIQLSFFENRVFEWYDAVANSIGVIVGICVFYLVRNVI